MEKIAEQKAAFNKTQNSVENNTEIKPKKFKERKKQKN
jgi:hypothetical protein